MPTTMVTTIVVAGVGIMGTKSKFQSSLLQWSALIEVTVCSVLVFKMEHHELCVGCISPLLCWDIGLCLIAPVMGYFHVVKLQYACESGENCKQRVRGAFLHVDGECYKPLYSRVKYKERLESHSSSDSIAEKMHVTWLVYATIHIEAMRIKCQRSVSMANSPEKCKWEVDRV